MREYGSTHKQCLQQCIIDTMRVCKPCRDNASEVLARCGDACNVQLTDEFGNPMDVETAKRHLQSYKEQRRH